MVGFGLYWRSDIGDNVVCTSGWMVVQLDGACMQNMSVLSSVGRKRRFRSQIYACMWCTYDARSHLGGLAFMQLVRDI